MCIGQRSDYSHTAKVLHWISAAVILWAIVTGLVTRAFADGPLREWLVSFNISLTTLFIPIFAVRVVYRLVAQPPAALDLPPAKLRLARLGHAVLYAATGVVLASGVLMMPHDIDVFSWITIPRPIRNAPLNNLFGDLHIAASITLAILTLGHILAVVRHERRGTRVLDRMVWSNRGGTTLAARLG